MYLIILLIVIFIVSGILYGFWFEWEGEGLGLVLALITAGIYSAVHTSLGYSEYEIRVDGVYEIIRIKQMEAPISIDEGPTYHFCTQRSNGYITCHDRDMDDIEFESADSNEMEFRIYKHVNVNKWYWPNSKVIEVLIAPTDSIIIYDESRIRSD